ncbi:phosphoglucomutase/phosphomannomutase family protein [bacterium]|nr:phosphoglucomutase/phosphomannomutase family protein [bacterium]
MSGIKFGTDGWRAVVGKDFNEENVRTVANAIGKYICDNYEKKEILIGYDPRNMAFEFAQMTAKILADGGFKVLISSKVVPTPVLAYGCKVHNACAIMFTASHNPPEYLGMKFIPDFAGPATSEITDELTSNLGEILSDFEGGKIVEYDFFDEYFEHLKTLIDFEKIKSVKVIYDGLYSATIGYFNKILDEYKIPYKSLHLYHDKNFGGGMPEPKPKYLSDLISQIKNENGYIGVANDGDGDRFGVINERGEYVTPNEIIAILLMYLNQNRGLQGSLVKTVGASLLLDKVAQKLGVKVIETAVGFKHVGAAMREYNPIIGGEESGGLSIQGHIPEKDGILANLLILEAMAVKNKSLVELQQELYNFAGCKFYNERVDLKLENQDLVKQYISKMEEFSNIGQYEIIRQDKKDGIKLYLDDNLSWILVRASGTEPLLRIYFESDSVEKIQDLKNLILNH